VATVPVGLNPAKVAITPNGSTAYVANAGSSSVSVINTATHAVTATVPVGLNPVGIAIH
jgi:YVTN family beta-propeller protein